MLALAREVGEARLEVGALNNLAVLAFHQESDPPRAKGSWRTLDGWPRRQDLKSCW